MSARRDPMLAVIGAGRAGLGLAACLARAGYSLTGLVARSRASAARASRLAGRGLGTTAPARPVRDAGIVLICVPDRAVARVAATLSELDLAGKAILHTSGILGPAPLAPLRRRGASVGCLHPLVSFPEPGRGPLDLRGVAFAVDGDHAALGAARRLVRALGGTPLRVPASRRGAYHLAASLAANDLAALLDISMEIASLRLGLSRTRARHLLLPLVRSVVESVSRSGPRRALTGPAARADRSTLERHLQALAREAPAARAAYRALTCRCIEMARREGRITAAQAADLRDLVGCRAPSD